MDVVMGRNIDYWVEIHDFPAMFDDASLTTARLAGAIVPLGFFAAPKFKKDDSPREARHKKRIIWIPRMVSFFHGKLIMWLKQWKINHP